MTQIRGVMPAMITPFHKDSSLNLEALPAYLKFQQDAGMDGVVVCGTNGEGVSMSVAERKRLLEAVIDLRGSLTVIAGTGAANLPDAIELTSHAAAAGADAALVLPPFFFKNPTAQGVVAFFRSVLDSAGLPVLLYSIPQQTAVQITDEIIGLLSDHPTLAGLKDSKGDWATTSNLITKWPKLSIFSGGDQIMDRSLKAGSAGAISGSANAFPDLVGAIKRLVVSGDTEAAQARLTAAKDILIQYPLIAAVKSVLAHRGLPRMHVRPPLIDLTPAQESEMIGRFRDAGLLAGS